MVEKSLKTLIFAKALLLNRVCKQGLFAVIAHSMSGTNSTVTDKVGHIHIQQHPTVNFSIEDTT